MIRYLNASQAARRLGVSAKALRLYEQAALLKPLRTEAGWRAYGPTEMEKAEEIVALRGLGLSLAQVGRVLGGDAAALEPALAAHQAGLEARAREIAETIARVRALRADLAAGAAPDAAALAALTGKAASVTLDLPWPWDGERFELPALGALTWLVGPLGSGKTRLAMALAAAIPGARFVGLDREKSTPSPAADEALAWLAGEGATASEALTALMARLCDPDAGALVVDLVEQHLDEPAQDALAAWLRRRPVDAPPLVLMTRSTAMLDLEAASAGERIIYCPANHSPPLLVAPFVGSPGYEALAGCLASPSVRARTEGMIATIPAA